MTSIDKLVMFGIAFMATLFLVRLVVPDEILSMIIAFLIALWLESKARQLIALMIWANDEVQKETQAQKTLQSVRIPK